MAAALMSIGSLETGGETPRREAAGKADALGIDRSRVSRTLRLATLSPEIVHRIVSGDVPPTLNDRRLRESIPLDWDEQERELLGE